LICHAKEVYIRTRFLIDKQVWPPEQPKEFSPLALIHHKGRRTKKEAVHLAEAGGGDVDSIMSAVGDQPAAKRLKIRNFVSLSDCLKRSKVTKDVAEILAPLEEPNHKLPLTLLIEGAPGIGKTILLKEISYRWAKKMVLLNSELVLLLCLRDPDVQSMKNLNDMIHYFYQNEPGAKELAELCAKYLLKTDGKNTTILFDGFDELPEHLHESGFIANIFKRKTLPECGIVISSRPHASAHLHENVIGRVDILGFSEDDRKHFIQHSLEDEPEKAKTLLSYITTHPSISSLCCVPFHMTVLLYLYKQGIALPNSSTQLYSLFICLTINRHLATKCGVMLQEDITDIKSLPGSYKLIIEQLAMLSLQALGDNQIVFTFNEIKEACPDFDVVPGAINGFGLLQAVQHAGITQTAVSLNFVHFSVQEYLAAYQVTCLSPNQEREILEKYFWDKNHLNMFSMYVGITKGQRTCFKEFLSNNGTAESGIADRFLEDQMKCLQLFKCFYEANDKKMCTAIYNANVFSSGRIDLDGNTLLPHDIECLTIFLTFVPHKVWKLLNLAYCMIGDVGCQILYRALVPNVHSITIEKIELWDNLLTSSSDPFISSIVLSCCTRMLWVSINIGLGETEGFFTMLAESSSVLEALYIGSCDLPTASAAILFKALRRNDRLQRLSLRNNFITDGITDYMSQAVRDNKCLQELYLRGNWISEEASDEILYAVQDNFTLKVLELPDYEEDIKENIKKQEEFINEHRKKHGCNVDLKIKY